MTITNATPYLFFDGTASQAMALYESALDAKIQNVMRYSEMPADVGTCPPAHSDRIMNASFTVGAATLMCSDRTEDKGVGNGDVQITLHFDDDEQMQRCFDKLAVDGEVMMPLHDAFWGDKFGVLKDKFGIGWQFIRPGNAS